jgi:hypothetical protein
MFLMRVRIWKEDCDLNIRERVELLWIILNLFQNLNQRVINQIQ